MLIVYRRLATLALFCQSCKRTWTEFVSVTRRAADAATAAPTSDPAPAPSTDGQVRGADKDFLRCESNLPCVLILDDEPSIRALLQRMLLLKGMCSVAVATDTDATAACEQGSFAAFIIDVHLRGGTSGISWVERLRSSARGFAPAVFVLTGERHLPESEQILLRTLQADVCFKGESLLPLVERVRTTITPPT